MRAEKHRITNVNSVIYISSTVPAEEYRIFLGDSEKTDQQAQKFHRAMMGGLLQNGYRVCAVSYRTGLSEEAFKSAGLSKSTEAQPIYHLLKSKGSGMYNRLHVCAESYRLICKELKKDSSAVVIADVLNISVASGAAFAAIRYHRPRVGIVTDVPGIYSKAGFNSLISMIQISLFSHYIFLTEAMSKVLNRKEKPYAVMEGLYYSTTEDKEMHQPDNTSFTVLYAGALDEKYGIKTMIDAVSAVNVRNFELHIFGTGDYVEQIKEAAQRNSCIRYFGVRENAEVIDAEKGASLLLNPRSKKELFTKYSFPSKTIEYMSTGIPVLMQDLPGMPAEYKEYVYLYSDDQEQALAKAINYIGGIPIDERLAKGSRAKKFILTKKNAAAQVSKVMSELGLFSNK